MLYNPKKSIDVQNAIKRLKWLIKNKKLFELTQKREIRSISQNSYMHLLFDWFALETGYTAAEVKQDIFKKHVNPKTFYDGDFEGSIITIDRWRSTADLNTKEMTLCIDRFRDFSVKEAGIYLPTPSDLPAIQEMKIELSKRLSQQYI